MNYEDKINLAAEKLEKMGDHHPSMVLYSEAKFLYTLISAMMGVLDLGNKINIDKLDHEDDIEYWKPIIDFIDAFDEEQK